MFGLICIIVSTQLSCKNNIKDESITIASAGKIDSLDPAQASTFRTLQILSSLGDTLYEVDLKGELIPKLASGKPKISNNKKIVYIPLRKNILFHDGEKFNAEAMAFSINRFMNIGTLNYILSDKIDNVKAAEEYLLVIELAYPSSSINKLLTSLNLTPISPKSYSNYKDKFLTNNFVGTGPYKLKFFSSRKQVLIPSEEYWDKKPKNKKINHVSFSNSSALYGAIVKGDIDLLISNSIEDTQRRKLHSLSKNQLLKEGIGPANEISFVSLRTNLPPFNNQKTREAISLSLNRSLISKKVSYGLREPTQSIIPMIYKSKKSEPWPSYSPALARNLLKESGYCNGNILEFELTFRSNIFTDKLIALTWQEQINKDLNDCLSIKLNGVESTTIYKNLSEGIYTAVIIDWIGSYPDPLAYLAPLLECNEIIDDICKRGEAVFSGSFWGSQNIQQLLSDSENLNGQEREDKFLLVDQITSFNSPYIPIWITKPRAWSRMDISKPIIDINGLVIFELLERLE
tara:strand:- start:7677 stop:9227 length:1551 start_codon:yes stop_codon:yes gene_type:complete